MSSECRKADAKTRSWAEGNLDLVGPFRGVWSRVGLERSRTLGPVTLFWILPPYPNQYSHSLQDYAFVLISIQAGELTFTRGSCAMQSTVPAPVEEAACLSRWVER